jgi:hypothetical protein
MGVADFLKNGLDGDTSLEDVFDEEPVDLQTFVQDHKFMRNSGPLSPIQFDAVRHIERVYFPELYPRMGKEFDPYWADPIRMVNYITLQWGKGAGKDFVCQTASARVAYLIYCLKSPQEYFGMAPHSTIHILNVAPAAALAQTVFFQPLVRILKRGWFEDKCDPKPGIGVVSWPHKNIEMLSGHADADSQEGLNLILGIADEIDAFKTKQEFQNRGSRVREPTKSAESLLDMISSSGSSRFSTFKSVQISFPRYIGSTIQLLTKKAKQDIENKKEKSKYYASGPWATWEVNPIYDKEPRVPVPGHEELLVPERLLGAYEDDLAEARSKYECKPSPAYNPYFRNTEAIDNCFVQKEHNPLEVSYRLVNSSEAVGGMVWEPVWEFAPDFYPIAGASYVMHGDLSINGDRAGIAMAHCVEQKLYEETIVDEDGGEKTITQTRPTVKVDFVIPFTSDLSTKPPREIQIRWGRQLAFELVKRGFNISLFSFDLFQSQDSQQILMAKGIESYRVSTDRDPAIWKNLRDLMYESRITIPYDELLKREVSQLTQLPNGKIDHLAGFSKDLADALACAAIGAVKIGGMESEDGERAYYDDTVIVMGHRMDMPLALREITQNSYSPLPLRPDTLE